MTSDERHRLSCRTEPLPGGGLRVLAPAKINLNLLVGPKREDGYHPLDSLVAKVTLFDTIEIRPQEEAGIGFACGGADCGEPARNLAYRAAALLAQGSTQPLPGVHITLEKAIPPGKGLGGGSSDAAAVLHAMNVFWRLRRTAGELMSLAAQLGSDVPLFLGPPACRMTGRGEFIEPLAVAPFFAVLVLPDCQCATPLVYRAFDDAPQPMGRQLDIPLVQRPVAQWRGLLTNQLGPPARRVSPPLAALWDELSAASQIPVYLTGSGSALFLLCDSATEAIAALARLPAAIRPSCRVVQNCAW